MYKGLIIQNTFLLFKAKGKYSNKNIHRMHILEY